MRKNEVKDFPQMLEHEDVAMLLHTYEPNVSLAVTSRVSDINEGQLSHYANGIKISTSRTMPTHS